MSSTKGEKKSINKLSVGVGKLPSHVEVEQHIGAWINDLPSGDISARFAASMIKRKAIELHPMFFGPIYSPHDLDGSKKHSNKQFAWCKTFLATRRFSSPNTKRDDRVYPEPASKGRLAQCVKKSWVRPMSKPSFKAGGSGPASSPRRLGSLRVGQEGAKPGCPRESVERVCW